MEKYNKETLENLIFVQKLPYNKIGEMYGVKGNAIKKAARRLGIELPVRRIINKEKENFSHKQEEYDNYVKRITDEEFTAIVQNSTSWAEIALKIGYKSKNLNTVRKKSIEERCESLGIRLNIVSLHDISYITKAELFERRPSWTSARCGIQKYAKRVFAEYGLEGKCAVCGYDKHVDIAHIKAVSEFDDNATIEEINNPNNLIGLCPNHHWEYDHGLLNLEDFLDTKNKKFEKDDIIK